VNVLVTGGAGYIGSHACKSLAAAGYNPVVVDNLSTGHRWAVQWGPLAVGDISDRELVAKIVKRFEIRSAVHFAAHAYVDESMELPRKYFDNNVSKTLALLDALLDGGVKSFVFSSSCATYGMPHTLPIAEDHPQSPINPYGASKLFTEEVLHWYEQAYNVRFMNLRYFNAAGADPNGQIGEDHTPETHLIPRVITAALGTNAVVEIFGTDYDTPDGTAVRDYVHVCDLADAHVKALDRLLAGGTSASINLGTGRGHSIREIISAVEAISGRTVSAIAGPRRAGDPPALVADPRLGQKLLGWKPTMSDLPTIVKTAWKWHDHGLKSSVAIHEPSVPAELPRFRRSIAPAVAELSPDAVGP
jgi:UDP-arabinose 4-epimerase